MKRTALGRIAAVLGTACLVVAGCSSSGGVGGVSAPKIAMQSSLGKGEGALNIIVWAGYAEDGSDDKTVDWVHPFEQQTGCQVNAKIGNTSDEMVSLMKTGQYEASDSGERLASHGNS